MKFSNLGRSIALILLTAPAVSMAQITVSVNFVPPELPVYEQPAIPGDGYVWNPGYWAYGEEEQDYYWVPGTWVQAPEPGLLWTPGYWAFSNGGYLWNAGYWGPHVGFYGGVNYGYGYTGEGYQGGYWRDNHLYYNRAVVNVGSTHITNVYNKTVINNVTVNRVSFNGGNGGLRAQPTATDQQAAHDRHVDFTPAQRQHVDAARQNTALRASENHGRPMIAATAEPGRFTGNVTQATRAGTVHPNPQQRGNPGAAGAGPRVPDQRDQGQPAARGGDNRINQPSRVQESNPAPRPAQTPHPVQPQVQHEAPRDYAPRPAPAPAPRPVQHEAPREAPRDAPRPPPAADTRREEVHSEPARPNEQRPQGGGAPARPAAPPRPPEREPERH